MVETSVLYYVYMLPGAFFAPVIHETIKAMASVKLGDPTPKKQGFLSGNPLKYFELIGFICMMIFGYGWGQPVPTSPVYYKDRKRGVMLAYITPALVNLIVGIITLAFLRLMWGVMEIFVVEIGAGGVFAVIAGAFFDILTLFAKCNIGLALFNIIPVHPLDGSKILALFLKPDWAIKMNIYEKFLQIFLLVMLALGLIGALFDPLVYLIMDAIW